jgi:hypothetical protein
MFLLIVRICGTVSAKIMKGKFYACLIKPNFSGTIICVYSVERSFFIRGASILKS